MARRHQRKSARIGHPFDRVPDLPCRNHDPELWFPQPGDAGRTGKNLCLTACPIREGCLAWALETGQHFGTWGGMTAGARGDLTDEQTTALIAAGRPQVEQIRELQRRPVHA